MKKYDNFCNALHNLKDIYDYEEPFGNVELTGMVGLFSVCFEQSWKAMKELLEDSGYDSAQTGSPRHIIKTAYQAAMIDDEELWLSALISRNNVAHAYNQVIALDIIHDTKTKYYDMFCKLKQDMEKNWI